LESIENEYRTDIDINTARSTALDYAIAFGCIESIRLLADADFGFSFDWNLRVGTKALDPAISGVVLSLVPERLRQLHHFSLQNLPSEVLRALQIERFENFDSKAQCVFNYFRTISIPIPRKFRRCIGFRGYNNLTYFRPFLAAYSIKLESMLRQLKPFLMRESGMSTVGSNRLHL
jgi:hypothetical protein